VLLPDGFHDSTGGFHQSYAYSIDAQGDVFGFALGDDVGFHAVEWTPVPEPAAAGVLWAMTAAAMSQRARRRI
jgi:hypothetical protein